MSHETKTHHMGDCPFCLGNDRWYDAYADIDVICPFCDPEGAVYQRNAVSWGKLPSPHASWLYRPAKHMGGTFQIPPYAIVLHCPAYGESCFEYMLDPGDKRIVSAHLVWSNGQMIQMVPFDRVAWHCKAHRMNFCSIGIELRGPWTRKRDDAEMDEIRALVEDVKKLIPSITMVASHSQLDPSRRDPGFILHGFQCLKMVDMK